MVKQFILGSLLLTANSLLAEKIAGKVWTTPESAKAENPDFLIQGEYGSSQVGIGLQVVALGDGKFDAYLLDGGLPGEGWDRTRKRQKVSGATNGSFVEFKNADFSISIKDSKASITQADKTIVLKRVERESPSLNAKPIEGAIVLFDGSDGKEWENAKVENGLLCHGTKSIKKFQNYTLHLEFMTPFRPFDRGQARGNSGVYHQARYETQVLDSFGLEGEYNETGGIYKVSKPILNMCFPPLRWQTYDVNFKAAVYEDGKKVKDPEITVKLNGVLIQENVKLPGATGSSPLQAGPDPGPIYLQNHGNPVFYKNIWIKEN